MTEAVMVERVEDYTDRPEPETHAYGPEPLRLVLQVVVEENERVREGVADIASLPQLPMQLIEKYVEVAVRHATLKRHPDGWVATILGFPGVWTKERSKEQALEVLKEVVRDWTLLKIQHKDKDLPVIEEIDLNVL
jgi:predicted RNase H-like HicB family nuclease